MNGSNSQPSYSMVLAHQGMEPLDEIIAQMSRRMLNRQIDDPTHRERVGAMNVYSEFPDLRISLDGVVLFVSYSVDMGATYSVCVWLSRLSDCLWSVSLSVRSTLEGIDPIVGESHTGCVPSVSPHTFKASRRTCLITCCLTCVSVYQAKLRHECISGDSYSSALSIICL